MNASYLLESLGSRRMGMDSFSAGHCESLCQSLSLSIASMAVLVRLHLSFNVGSSLELSSVYLARTPKRAKQRGLLEPGLEPGPGKSRRPNARGQTRTRSWQGPPDTNEKPEARRQQRPEAGRPARGRGQRARPDFAERLVANAGQNLKAQARRNNRPERPRI